MRHLGEMICIVLLLVMHVANAQTGNNDILQREVVNAAQTDFIPFLKNCLPSAEAQSAIGLSAGDNIDKAQLGKPFQLYLLPLQKINRYSGKETVQTLVEKTSMWYFPIIFSGKFKLILYVDLQEGTWTKVGIGSSGLAKELDAFSSKWATGNTEILLIQQRDGGDYLFHVPQIDSYNLTRSQIDKADNANRYSVLQTPEQTISFIKNRLMQK